MIAPEPFFEPRGTPFSEYHRIKALGELGHRIFARLKDLQPELHQALWGAQSFYRVLSTVNGGRRQETDLFEGLRG